MPNIECILEDDKDYFLLLVGVLLTLGLLLPPYVYNELPEYAPKLYFLSDVYATSFISNTSTLPLLMKYMCLPVSPCLIISSEGKNSMVLSLLTI
jgi:hypothetical protein